MIILIKHFIQIVKIGFGRRRNWSLPQNHQDRFRKRLTFKSHLQLCWGQHVLGGPIIDFTTSECSLLRPLNCFFVDRFSLWGSPVLRLSANLTIPRNKYAKKSSGRIVIRICYYGGIAASKVVMFVCDLIFLIYFFIIFSNLDVDDAFFVIFMGNDN